MFRPFRIAAAVAAAFHVWRLSLSLGNSLARVLSQETGSSADYRRSEVQWTWERVVVIASEIPFRIE